MRTDLLKRFGYWDENMSYHGIFAMSVFFDYSDADIEFSLNAIDLFVNKTTTIASFAIAIASTTFVAKC